MILAEIGQSKLLKAWEGCLFSYTRFKIHRHFFRFTFFKSKMVRSTLFFSFFLPAICSQLQFRQASAKIAYTLDHTQNCRERWGKKTLVTIFSSHKSKKVCDAIHPHFCKNALVMKSFASKQEVINVKYCTCKVKDNWLHASSQSVNVADTKYSKKTGLVCLVGSPSPS